MKDEPMTSIARKAGDTVTVDGTVVHILDHGSRERPWRALVQDRGINNTVHVSLMRKPDAEEGDNIKFTGRCKAPFLALSVGVAWVGVPAQVELPDDDAMGRMALLMSSRTLSLTTSDDTPAVPVPWAGSVPVSVLRRPRRGTDPAVNWVAARFSEGKAARHHGPVIILDPVLCSMHAPDALDSSDIPFVYNRATQYILESSRSGRAGMRTTRDMSDPWHRWWGVVIPKSLFRDPLIDWHGFVGQEGGISPAVLVSPEASLRFLLAHEMAHVVQHAYGITISDELGHANGHAECFADCSALMLHILDGGDVAQARTYAHQRAAGAFQMPGSYSTGVACHVAIVLAQEMLSEGGTWKTDDVLRMAADVSCRHQPPPPAILKACFSRSVSGFTPDAEALWESIRDTRFDAWLDSLPKAAARVFAAARDGVMACVLPPEARPEQAADILRGGWDAIADRLKHTGMAILLPDLQAAMGRAFDKMLGLLIPTENRKVIEMMRGYEVTSAAIDRNASPLGHAHVVATASDPWTETAARPAMEELWCMALHERCEFLREIILTLDDDAQSLRYMGEVAMSILLDAECRAELSQQDTDIATLAWSASLSSDHACLQDLRDRVDASTKYASQQDTCLAVNAGP